MSDLFDASVQRFRLLDLDDEPTTPTPELDDEPGRQLIMDDEPDYQDGRAAALREIESDAWTPELRSKQAAIKIYSRLLDAMTNRRPYVAGEDPLEATLVEQDASDADPSAN